MYGSHGYFTLWPTSGQPKSCGWGAEDDFFEQAGRLPRRIWSTTHTWTSACAHKVAQNWYDIARWGSWNAYGVTRQVTLDVPGSLPSRGCVAFYVNGQRRGGSCERFRSYLMGVSGGIGKAPNVAATTATIKVRRITVWRGV